MATPKEISPTTVAAFLSAIGSPQFDAFTGGGFLGFVNAVGSSRAVATQLEERYVNLCECGNNPGCGTKTPENPLGACSLCKSSSNQPLECFCFAVRSTITAPGGLQANTPFYTCAPNSGTAIQAYNLYLREGPRPKAGDLKLRDRDWWANQRNLVKS